MLRCRQKNRKSLLLQCQTNIFEDSLPVNRKLLPEAAPRPLPGSHHKSGVPPLENPRPGINFHVTPLIASTSNKMTEQMLLTIRSVNAQPSDIWRPMGRYLGILFMGLSKRNELLKGVMRIFAILLCKVNFFKLKIYLLN